jgi:hypothetical protein
VLEHDQQRLLLTPPSRAGSRATLASLGSFSLNPIASPALREPSDVTGNQIRGVASVLDGFDPSFLSQVNTLAFFLYLIQSHSKIKVSLNNIFV